MDSNQPAENPVPTSGGIFGTKIPSAASFFTAILLFLLPFLDIRCNDLSIQKISGLELATGFRIDAPGSDNSIMGSMERSPGLSTGAKGERKDPNVLALVTLALGVVGFLFSLVGGRASMAAGILIGVLSAVAMIAMMIDIKSEIKVETGNDDGVRVAVEFTVWFYLSIAAFILASVFSYRRLRHPRPTTTST